MTRYRPAIGSTERARRLRRRLTKAETAMLRILRLAFAEAHFRKQVPIGCHVADFASHSAKLIIGVDGGQHGGTRDEERTKMLNSAGYRVIRFRNNDVLGNPDGVARIIEAALLSSATPTPPSPLKGEGARRRLPHGAAELC